MTKTKRPRPAKSIRGFRPTLSTPLANQQRDIVVAIIQIAIHSRDLTRAKIREASRYEADGRTLMAGWCRASAVHYRLAMRSRALWARVFAGQVGANDPRLATLKTQTQTRSILVARALLWQQRSIRLTDGTAHRDERRRQLIEKCEARERAFLARLIVA